MERISEVIIESQNYKKPIHVDIENLLEEVYSVEVPQALNALNLEQLCKLASLYFTKDNKGGYLIDFIRELLALDKKDFALIDLEDLNDLKVLADPFVSKKQVCIKVIATGINYNGEFYKGPLDGISDVVFEEYIYLEQLKEEFLSSKKESSLNAFAAVFFRNRMLTFEYYTHYEEEDIEKMKKLPNKYKLAAVLNFMGITNWFPNEYPNVYRNSGGDSGNGKKWRKTIISLAGEKLGQPNDVRNTYVLDVLEHLNELLKKG